MGNVLRIARAILSSAGGPPARIKGHFPPRPRSIAYKIYSIVLAAGEAKRFGANKLLSSLNDSSLLGCALSAAQKACPGRVCLVTGHKSGEISREAFDGADLFADNKDYQSGIGSSIACGVRACGPHADAVVIMLADQPTIGGSHVQALINAWSGDEDEIVLSTHAGTQAPPTLFGRGVFEQLVTLTGDSGARGVIQSGLYKVRQVNFPDPAIDIDTEEDYRRLKH